MPRVHFPDGREIRVSEGESVAAVLQKAGEAPWLPCGGKGYCGRCRVQLEGNLTPPTAAETEHLSPAELAQGVRLACQARIAGEVSIVAFHSLTGAQILTDTGDPAAVDPGGTPLVRRVELRLPPPTAGDQRSDLTRLLSALGSDYLISLPLLSALPRILREQEFEVTAYLGNQRLLALKPGSGHGAPYGLAIDVGTTTLVAYLWDLEQRERLAAAASANPQTVCGDDVISRIAYASEEKEGLARLQALVLAGINGLVEELTAATGISPQDIYQVVLVGNTCMQHFFLGIDPRNLGRAPYVPACQGPVTVTAGEIGLAVYREAQVEFLPNIAGFLGSDALACTLWANLAGSPGNVLLVDLGTNGELLLATAGGIVASSTAAGPAFEGAGLSCGMRAVNGAIDRISPGSDRLRLHVIGSGAPQGICGSGLIDGLGTMLTLGLLEPGGRIRAPGDVSLPWRDYLVTGENGYDFSLEPGGTIRITQRDVRKIQLAKGAIAAGVKTLLDHVGLTPQDLDEILLAGGFGNYLNIENAQRLGLIPSVPPERVRFVGNAAGAGAQMVLLSREARERALELVGTIHYLELAGNPLFGQAYMETMLFLPW